jgi:hypothetical protein
LRKEKSRGDFFHRKLPLKLAIRIIFIFANLAAVALVYGRDFETVKLKFPKQFYFVKIARSYLSNYFLVTPVSPLVSQLAIH